MAASGRLAGKVALVTGAARGIGAEIARLFSAEGAAVWLGDRRDETGAEVARSIEASGGRAAYGHLDVGSELDWKRAVEDAALRFGGLDILINNAGILRVRPLAECSAEEFREVLETNLVGTFLGMRAVLAQMLQRRGASIVNVSSLQGADGHYGMSAYSAAKFGVRGLSKSAAIELGPHGIRVNTLLPGPTRTPMSRRQGWSDADYDRAYSAYPLGRIGEPSEIACLALFLASEESSFCTGADFVVDGGASAGGLRR